MSPFASLLAIPYPAIDPIALQLGPIAIRWYGLAYVAGLLLGWLYMKRLLATPSLWRDQTPPFRPALADDLFIWVAIGVIVGGRLGNVLLYDPGYYFSDPLKILYVWQGGMAFHGGLLGTILAMWLFARRHRISALSVMDLVSAAVPIGLFFGRIANFINSEIVGRETNLPWGMVFPGWGDVPRHPVQLYEAALEGLVLFLLLRYLVRRHQALASPGLIGAAFLAGYGTFRIICEFFKFDEHRPIIGEGWLTTGMLYSIPMILVGVIAFIVLWRPKSA
jgi:phosphatidylglycerol---prolipoprotein diacylglyceryl transferase